MKSANSLLSDANARGLPGSLAERLQLALDAGAIAGTWFWDVEQNLFTADGRFAVSFGLDEGRLLEGIPVNEVTSSLHIEDVERVSALIATVLAQGGRYRAEHRVKGADGTYRWFEANGRVSLNVHGQAVTFSGVLVDVHHRKQTELFQASLLQLGDALRGVDDVATIASIASRISATCLGASRSAYGSVDANAEFIDIRGDWKNDSGRSNFFGKYKFDDYGSYVDTLKSGEVLNISDVTKDARTAAKTAAYAEMGAKSLLNVPLMRDGRLAALFVAIHTTERVWSAEEIDFVRGIADRTWAALATASAHEELKALNCLLAMQVEERTADRDRLWELSRDMLLVSTFSGEIVATNPAWNAVLGWAEDELVGTSLLDLIHPDDLEHTISGASSIESGTAYPSFENRYRHKNGSYRNMSWSASPGGNFIIAAGRDVTAQLEQAETLKTAEEQLRQSQKMETVGQLTGGIAHDFNNLLTIVSTSLQLLQKPGLAEERRQRFLGSISSAVVRASKLTGQLLAFARRQSLQPVVFNAIKNVVAIKEMLQTLAGSRIAISIDALDEHCVVDVDPAQFDAAIVNLVANARDAMSDVGQISICTTRVGAVPSSRSNAGVTGEFVAVTVSDEGSGIAPDLLDRVFEPFYTTKPVGQGTGLGLSQVFGFAKQSRGDVRVQSVPGKGASFTIYLPVSKRPLPAESMLVPEVMVAPTAVGRLLYVEDNADVAAATLAILEELGYEVVGVDNGNDALARLVRDKAGFAAVMSDVMMAPMDGVTLARRIHADHPSMPILLCSGYSSFLASTHEHGFKVLPKPFSIEQLSNALRGLFSEPQPSKITVVHDELPVPLTSAQEAARVTDLHSLHVLDTAEEIDYDEVVLIAAALFDAPTALITLIDKDRQWFKARTGYVGREIPRIESVCSYAIQTPNEVMVVGDLAKDPRFADNTHIKTMSEVQFYVGAPLVTARGNAIGTVCVFDTVPREPDPRQLVALKLLAKQVVERLERRRPAQQTSRLQGA